MIKRVSGLILLVVMMICSVSLSVTYSKYLLSKSVSGEIKTKANCIDMGITSLSECMLVMDSNVNNVESAKLYISSKVADLTKMAPTINYAEKSELVTNENGILNVYTSVDYYSSYSFDSITGMYTLEGDLVREKVSDKVINYYTCGGFNYNVCTTMYQIKDYTINTPLNVVTSAIVYTQTALDSFDSEIGLYATIDDYGTSYYYRGNVKNNYVSYAGYIWRIIRQNGDGSIRLIYSGDEATDTGRDTFTDQVVIDKQFYSDLASFGYMYNEDFQLFTNDDSTNWYLNFLEDAKMYFSDSYEFDENMKMFNLTGNYLYGTWKDNYEEIIANYPYTCRSSNTLDKCGYVIHAKGYGTDYMMLVNLITYSSKSYEVVTTNKLDSSFKRSVDTWYENNILNVKDSNDNLLTTYLSDEIFCNDRSVFSGTGYISSEYTFYSGYNRIVNNTPSLLCSQKNDMFTVSNSKGNEALTYPIGLLTADEAMYAGFKYNAVNTLNYLNVGENYWTMTPFYYDAGWVCNRIVYINQGVFANYVELSYGIRPVINLRSDIKIMSGDGTTEAPYVVTI